MPAKAVWIVGGSPTLAAAASMAFTASPSATPGLQIEGNRHRRKKPLVSHGQRRGGGRELGEGAQRNLLSARRTHVDLAAGTADSARTPARPPSPRGTGSATLYMVETCRWPKASYSVLSISCGEMPKRAAVAAIVVNQGLQPAVLLIAAHVGDDREWFSTAASILGANSVRSSRLSPCMVN